MKSRFQTIRPLTDSRNMSTQPSTSPYIMSNTEALIYNLTKSVRAFEAVLYEKNKEIAQLKACIKAMEITNLPQPVVEKVGKEQVSVPQFLQKKPERPKGKRNYPEDKYTKSDIGRIIFSTQFGTDCRIEKVSRDGSRIQIMNFNDLKYYWIPSPPRSNLLKLKIF